MNIQTATVETVPARPELQYTRIPVTEHLSLAHPRNRMALVEIQVGQHDGKWFWGYGFQKLGGDCLGGGCGVGFWNTAADRRVADTRDDAVKAASALLRKTFERSPKEFSAHLEWLDGLFPAQRDLFA